MDNKTAGTILFSILESIDGGWYHFIADNAFYANDEKEK